MKSCLNRVCYRVWSSGYPELWNWNLDNFVIFSNTPNFGYSMSFIPTLMKSIICHEIKFGLGAANITPVSAAKLARA